MVVHTLTSLRGHDNRGREQFHVDAEQVVDAPVPAG